MAALAPRAAAAAGPAGAGPNVRTVRARLTVPVSPHFRRVRRQAGLEANHHLVYLTIRSATCSKLEWSDISYRRKIRKGFEPRLVILSRSSPGGAAVRVEVEISWLHAVKHDARKKALCGPHEGNGFSHRSPSSARVRLQRPS